MKRKQQNRKIELIRRKSANRANYIIKSIEFKIDQLSSVSKNAPKLNDKGILFHTSKQTTNIHVSSKNFAVKGAAYKLVLTQNKVSQKVNAYIPKPPIKKPSPEKPETKPEKPAEEKK